VETLDQARARYVLSPEWRNIEFRAKEPHLLSAGSGLSGHLASQKALTGKLAAEYRSRQAFAQLPDRFNRTLIVSFQIVNKSVLP
jgi:hypothetical protein